jgi:hypothetical protein
MSHRLHVLPDSVRSGREVVSCVLRWWAGWGLRALGVLIRRFNLVGKLVLPGKDTYKPGTQQNSWVTPLEKLSIHLSFVDRAEHHEIADIAMLAWKHIHKQCDHIKGLTRLKR